MNRSRPANLPASIQARLLSHAQEQSIPYQRVLTRYAAERLLYRISRSDHRRRFCLKGAMLFALWNVVLPRPTRDLDLLGAGLPGQDGIEQAFHEICETQVEDDGLRFDPGTLVVEQIRDDTNYGGIRIGLLVMLGNSRIQLQVDVGIGDVVTPEAQEADFPVLLDQPAPRILVYPRESVISEKLEAMVAMGLPNSRMKDFYDIWYLSSQFDFDGPVLCQAIEATFKRRQTPLPNATPAALTSAFGEDDQKRIQWTAFLRRAELAEASLPDVVSDLRAFLWPPLEALVLGRPFGRVWKNGGPWEEARPV